MSVRAIRVPRDSGSVACKAAFPEVRTRARELFARLRTRPIEARFPDEQTVYTLTADHVAEALRTLTYSTRNCNLPTACCQLRKVSSGA